MDELWFVIDGIRIPIHKIKGIRVDYDSVTICDDLPPHAPLGYKRTSKIIQGIKLYALTMDDGSEKVIPNEPAMKLLDQLWAVWTDHFKKSKGQ
jgi:hypothetical protein